MLKARRYYCTSRSESASSSRHHLWSSIAHTTMKIFGFPTEIRSKIYPELLGHSEPIDFAADDGPPSLPLFRSKIYSTRSIFCVKWCGRWRSHVNLPMYWIVFDTGGIDRRSSRKQGVRGELHQVAELAQRRSTRALHSRRLLLPEIIGRGNV